jgi:hypothetical protein
VEIGGLAVEIDLKTVDLEGITWHSQTSLSEMIIPHWKKMAPQPEAGVAELFLLDMVRSWHASG